MNYASRSSALFLALFSAACSTAPDPSSEDGAPTPLALDVPAGQFGMYAVASPPEGGTANVRVSVGGATQCSGTECAGDLGSVVEFTATANSGYTFAGWSGCAYAVLAETTNPLIGFIGFADETCTATFDKDATTQPTTPTQPTQPTQPSELSIKLDVSALRGAGVGVNTDGTPSQYSSTATYRGAPVTFAGGKVGIQATFTIHLPLGGLPKLKELSNCPNSSISFMGTGSDYLSYQVNVLTEDDVVCGIVTTAGTTVYVDAYYGKTAPSIAATDPDRQCIGWGGGNERGLECIFEAGTTVTVDAEGDNFKSMSCKGKPAVSNDGLELSTPTRTFSSLAAGSSIDCRATFVYQGN